MLQISTLNLIKFNFIKITFCFWTNPIYCYISKIFCKRNLDNFFLNNSTEDRNIVYRAISDIDIKVLLYNLYKLLYENNMYSIHLFNAYNTAIVRFTL